MATLDPSAPVWIPNPQPLEAFPQTKNHRRSRAPRSSKRTADSQEQLVLGGDSVPEGLAAGSSPARGSEEFAQQTNPLVQNMRIARKIKQRNSCSSRPLNLNTDDKEPQTKEAKFSSKINVDHLEEAKSQNNRDNLPKKNRQKLANDKKEHQRGYQSNESTKSKVKWWRRLEVVDFYLYSISCARTYKV